MPTIHDVAKHAGVTPTTVSRVLNNRGYISDKTRKKVYSSMEELNYQPNEIARSLKNKQSNIIGLIVPDVSHPFFASFASHIEYFAYEKGMKVLLCNSHLDPVKEKEYIDMMRGNRVDGIIMSSHTLETEQYLNVQSPIVTFDRQIGDIPFISSDNYMGGKLATELLIRKGCRKIAHICGNLQLNLLANERSKAFLDVVNVHNVEHIVIETDINVFHTREYQQLIRDMLLDHPDLDGIFATSDIIAAYVIKECMEMGISVPEQIKVVGYDDVSVAPWITPSLTTIRQPIEEIGKLSITLLSQQINNEDYTIQNQLDVTLIERASTM